MILLAVTAICGVLSAMLYGVQRVFDLAMEL